MNNLIDFLAFTNDVLQSAIVIFGTSIVLNNIQYSLRDRVTRAFSALLGFVVVVYMTELVVTRAVEVDSAEPWLRFGWLGIAFVPSAMFHLSDALLATTGEASRRRRLFVRVGYTLSTVFLGLVLFTDLLVGELVAVQDAPHLQARPLSWLFTVFFFGMVGLSLRNVWRARRRCLIQATRRRMTLTFIGLLAPAIGVYPYLLISSNPNLNVSLWLWLALVFGNLMVAYMFALLTFQLVYFGHSSPDRVVRVRLYKFLARVPLPATLVLAVLVLVNRTSDFLGLEATTATAVAVVATVILAEWAVHTFKRPLERLFQLSSGPDVQRIQQLSERVLTTREIREFLESVLAAACDGLRSSAAFVVAFTPNGPRLETAVGPPEDLPEAVQGEALKKLASKNGHGDEDTIITIDGEPLEEQAGLYFWHGYWIQRLWDSSGESLVGILGLRARPGDEAGSFTAEERELFEQLADQAGGILEDRLLQEDVFAAVEGLLPAITERQLRRTAAAYGGAPALTAPSSVANDPEFNGLVRDALTHYWGGPKLTNSPLLRLRVVQEATDENDPNPVRALREVLLRAIELQRPEGERSMTRAEWLLYNILELKFVEGRKVRDVALRLAMSESDLYRKQRVAIENVAKTIAEMERTEEGDLVLSADPQPDVEAAD